MAKGLECVKLPLIRGQKVTRRKDANGDWLPCLLDDCALPVYARGLCNKHYQSRRDEGFRIELLPLCPIPGCVEHVGIMATACRKHNKIIFRYGVTVERLIELFTDARCEACAATGDLVVDHDHTCCPAGKFEGYKVACGVCVRGLLCRRCNSALGMLDDDPEKIRGLNRYLSSYESTR